MKLGLFAIFTVFLSSSVLAAPVFKSDQYFMQQQYEHAWPGYRKAAELGNPHAYYQMAHMYLRGMGTKVDTAAALSYFALAAEYDYYNAAAVKAKMLDWLPASQRPQVEAELAQFLRQHGRQAIEQQLFPIVKPTQALQPLRFGKNAKARLQGLFYTEELAFYAPPNSELPLSISDEPFIRKPYEPYVILDVDIASDGSVRHYKEVIRQGRIADDIIEAFLEYPLPAPSLNGTKAKFMSRVYLGAAAYNRFGLLDENSPVYNDIRRQVKRYRRSEQLHERYLFAFASLNFRSVTRKQEPAIEALAELAAAGHPNAMYEYGMALYRRQQNINTAVYWLSQAAKYGIPEAEYHLGQLLLASPWVERDETKALFWLNLAMQQGDVDATMAIIGLKLEAQNEALRDVNAAISLLDKVHAQMHQHPEYQYYRALSLKHPEHFDFVNLIKHLKKAIRTANGKNWDVSEWESLLARLQAGRIDSCEYVVGNETACL